MLDCDFQSFRRNKNILLHITLFTSTFSKEIIASFVSSEKLGFLLILRGNHISETTIGVPLPSVRRVWQQEWGEKMDPVFSLVLQFISWVIWSLTNPAITCAVQRRCSESPQSESNAECANPKPEPIFLNSNFTQFIESHLGDKESFLKQVKMLKQSDNFKMFWGRADWYFELCFCSTLVRKCLYTLAFSNNIGSYAHW